MLNSGKNNNILILVLSEKKFLNETKNHNPPPPLFKLNGRSLTMFANQPLRNGHPTLHIAITPNAPLDAVTWQMHIHTKDQTGKNFYHVTQFHPITVNYICFRYISCHIDIKKSIYKLLFTTITDHFYEQILRQVKIFELFHQKVLM